MLINWHTSCCATRDSKNTPVPSALGQLGNEYRGKERKRMIRNRIVFLVLLVVLGLASLPAQADTLRYTFTSDHCSAVGGVTCLTNFPNGAGLITVTDVAGGVSVDVQLPATWGFVST